jgi:alanine-glyoxylate transaminase/serine-glyoxylate transaminase/serine-pyruvate transaminase
MIRQVVNASEESQPFLVAGSGTLGWDMVGTNLLERGDEVVVLHTGYFGDAFADW